MAIGNGGGTGEELKCSLTSVLGFHKMQFSFREDAMNLMISSDLAIDFGFNSDDVSYSLVDMPTSTLEISITPQFRCLALSENFW
jgi:hypothetical protein